MPHLFDKRSIVRDHRSADIGMSRRIALRIPAAPSTPAYSSDPTIDTAQNRDPSTDTITYVVGTFSYLKTTQSDGEEGNYQESNGIVRFHPMFMTLLEKCYAMSIGGTEKTWRKVSPPLYDGQRSCITVKVTAVA